MTRKRQVEPPTTISLELNALLEAAQDSLEDGSLDDSAIMFAEALDMAEQAYGSDHPYVALCQFNLCRIFYDLQDTVNVSEVFQLLLNLARTKLGLKHPDLQAYLTLLSKKYKKLGLRAEADYFSSYTAWVTEQKGSALFWWDDLLVEAALENPDSTATVPPAKPVEPITPDITVEPARPVTPVTPAEPIEPFTPVMPTEPFKPVMPTEPFKPVMPTEPFKPVMPTEPFKPVIPTEPFKPVMPTEPFKPVMPDEPIEPFQPVTPDEPIEPVTQVMPSEPFEPFQPVTPDELIEPVTQVMQSEPFEPFQPVTPDELIEPVTQVMPTEPFEPSQPVTPDELIEIAQPVFTKPMDVGRGFKDLLSQRKERSDVPEDPSQQFSAPISSVQMEGVVRTELRDSSPENQIEREPVVRRADREKRVVLQSPKSKSKSKPRSDYKMLLIGLLNTLLLLVLTAVLVFQSGLFLTSSPVKAGKTLFATPDARATIRFTDADHATFDVGGHKTVCHYSNCNLQDIPALIIGSLSQKPLWLRETAQGLRSENGVLFFSTDAPETTTIKKMNELSAFAQKYYQHNHSYPQNQQCLDASAGLAYTNPYTQARDKPSFWSYPAIYNKGWKLADSNRVAYFPDYAEAGLPWITEPESMHPGSIESCGLATEEVLHDGSRRVTEFFIHGCDRNGDLLPASQPGKCYCIFLKNGRVQGGTVNNPDQSETPTEILIPKNIQFAQFIFQFGLLLAIGCIIVVALVAFLKVSLKANE